MLLFKRMRHLSPLLHLVAYQNISNICLLRGNGDEEMNERSLAGLFSPCASAIRFEAYNCIFMCSCAAKTLYQMHIRSEVRSGSTFVLLKHKYIDINGSGGWHTPPFCLAVTNSIWTFSCLTTAVELWFSFKSQIDKPNGENLYTCLWYYTF